MAQSCLILCYPMDCSPPRLCPWDFPGKNIGAGCHFLLQGIVPTQGSNPCLLHWQADSFTTEPPGKPKVRNRHMKNINRVTNLFNLPKKKVMEDYAKLLCFSKRWDKTPILQKMRCPHIPGFKILSFLLKVARTLFYIEMAGWHHQLDGREFGWTPGVGDGQGGLACCSSRGCRELDTTERLTGLNWTNVC